MSNQAELQNWFSRVDSDGSGQLSANELQQALVNGDMSQFSLSTVKLFIDMFDGDQTGTINFQEFQNLYQYIIQWQNCFRSFDRDQSNTMQVMELGFALQTFGFNLSPQFLTKLIKKLNKHKYQDSKKFAGYQGPDSVTFDQFIEICVRVRMYTESFRRFDNNNDGTVMINYEQFLDLVSNN